MMFTLALLASATLIVIAALHLLWALGYWFPIKDEAELVRTVAGFRGVEKMPGAVPCALVVVALLFAAALPWMPDTGLRGAGLFVVALAFQTRAILAFAPIWKRATPEQPFRRLDETYYAPLCILLGLIFMVLAGQAAA